MRSLPKLLFALALVHCVMLSAGAVTLTINVVGNGTTTPSPGSHSYSWLSTVEITAIPDPGWKFDHWEGNLSGDENPESITLWGNRTVTAVFVALPPASPDTALVRYVEKYDPNFTWSQYDSVIKFGYTTFFIDMISQQWRTAAEVDHPLWQHYLIIHKGWFTGDTAIILIDGGSNGGTPPNEADDAIGYLSLLTGIPIADLKQVPNEPLLFADETETRSEDEILAYSLDKYVATEDPEWPVHLAMVKAAVRGMDAVQEKLSSVSDFVVAGASKRGWATWLTAAYDDPRIIGFVPLVIDILNIELQMEHHWDSYGFYSSAVQDYADFDLFCRMDSPEGQDLLEIVDPYRYIGETSAYNLPKLIGASTGDQFFMPDAMQYYIDDIPGQINVRYLPNTDHSMDQGDAYESALTTVAAWAGDVKDGQLPPSYSWSFEPDGSIRVYAPGVDEVKLWQATNATARDFRYETIGAAYTSTVLTEQPGSIYIGSVSTPAQGWTCFMVEIDHGNGEIYTSPCRVIPDVEPYDGTHCQ